MNVQILSVAVSLLILSIFSSLPAAETKPSPKIIELVSYDPAWPQLFEQEAQLILRALGNNCLDIYHFGSTSVPGLSAKPKIDILAVVKNMQSIDSSALERIGFESRGEVIPTGQYFSKELPKVHLHVFAEGNPDIERCLMFRDYLRDHEDAREAYAALKRHLADIYCDGMDYSKAKTEFVDQIIEKAKKCPCVEVNPACVKLSVAHISQNDMKSCATTSVAMAISYYEGLKIPLDKETVWKISGTEETCVYQYGNDMEGLKRIADFYGYQSEYVENMDISEIEDLLSKGILVMLNVENANFTHAILAIGYDHHQKRLFINDPADRQNTAIKYSDLETHWSAHLSSPRGKSFRSGFLIYPK